MTEGTLPLFDVPAVRRQGEFLGVAKRRLVVQNPCPVAFDTVVRFIGRTRRYLLTTTDHASRFALAIAVSRHDSQHAARASRYWSKPCFQGASSRCSRTMVASPKAPLPTMPERRDGATAIPTRGARK